MAHAEGIVRIVWRPGMEAASVNHLMIGRGAVLRSESLIDGDLVENVVYRYRTIRDVQLYPHEAHAVGVVATTHGPGGNIPTRCRLFFSEDGPMGAPLAALNHEISILSFGAFTGGASAPGLVISAVELNRRVGERQASNRATVTIDRNGITLPVNDPSQILDLYNDAADGDSGIASPFVFVDDDMPSLRDIWRD